MITYLRKSADFYDRLCWSKYRWSLKDYLVIHNMDQLDQFPDEQLTVYLVDSDPCVREAATRLIQKNFEFRGLM